MTKEIINVFFVDESISKDDKFSIIGGIFFDIAFLFDLENDLRQLLNNNGLSSLEEIRKEQYDIAFRKEVSKKIKNILFDYNTKIITVIIKGKEKFIDKIKQKFGTYKIYDSPLLSGLYLLIERYYLELKTENKKGIIFYDKTKDKEYLLEALYNDSSINIKANKTSSKYFASSVVKKISSEKMLKRIYSITFLDNKKSLIMQVSDLITGAVREAVSNFFKEKENNFQRLENSLDNLNSYFYALDIYFDLFAKDSDNKIKGYGIKIWV